MGSATRCALAAAALAASFGARAIEAEWTAVDITPGTMGRAEAISQNGIVVGCYMAGTLPRAFVYANGERRDLPAPQGVSSCASAVNNAGLIAGTVDGEITVWESGNMHRLGVKGSAAAMNESGVIVGSMVSGPADANGLTPTRAYMLANGVFTDLGSFEGATSSWASAINNRGQIVGSSGGKVFLYENGAMRDPGIGIGSANGINDRGEIVGGSSFGQGPEPYIYDGTKRRIPGAYSFAGAVGINNVGQILGSGEGIYGFLMENGNAATLDSLAGAPWHHSEPNAINDRGWIVGQGGSPDFHALLLMPKDATTVAASGNPAQRPAMRARGPGSSRFR